jgi:hypothetical protein
MNINLLFFEAFSVFIKPFLGPKRIILYFCLQRKRGILRGFCAPELPAQHQIWFYDEEISSCEFLYYIPPMI